jgi:hypothetical protein
VQVDIIVIPVDVADITQSDKDRFDIQIKHDYCNFLSLLAIKKIHRSSCGSSDLYRIRTGQAAPLKVYGPVRRRYDPEPQQLDRRELYFPSGHCGRSVAAVVLGAKHADNDKVAGGGARPIRRKSVSGSPRPGIVAGEKSMCGPKPTRMGSARLSEKTSYVHSRAAFVTGSPDRIFQWIRPAFPLLSQHAGFHVIATTGRLGSGLPFPPWSVGTIFACSAAS